MMKLLLITSFFITLASSLSFADGIIPITEVTEPAGHFDPKDYMKVAVVQWNPPDSAEVGITPQQAEVYKRKNRKLMADRIANAVAKGAKFVVFSEFAVVGYPDIPELPPEEDNFRNRDDIAPYVEKIPGTSTNYFAPLAIKYGIFIQFGLAEVDPATNNYHNTLVVIDPQGKIVAKYRKMHLYMQESDYLVPGTTPVVFDSPIGKMGFLICSDVYDGGVLDYYIKAGVKVLSLSTSWAAWNSGMDSFKSAARSVNAYLMAANQTYFPGSGVINPDGSTQSHVRQTLDVIAYGYIPYSASTK
jgi:predicted amidohydrolase